MKGLFIFIVTLFISLGINAQENNHSISDKVNKKPRKEREIFVIVEEMPILSGCELESTKDKRNECTVTKLYDYIEANLKYPEKALNQGVEGRVTARFVINSEGIIDNIKILINTKKGYGFAKEAKRLIFNMNNLPKKWIPGSQGGRKVNCFFTMPIKFKLPKKPKRLFKKL